MTVPAMNRADRDASIVLAYKEGKTGYELAALHGLTYQRVFQILKKSGVSYLDSSRHIAALSNSAARQARVLERREAKCLRLYGCDIASFRLATGSSVFRSSTPMAKMYLQHRDNAMKFRISWEITLPAYAKLIGPHFNKIGRGKMTLCRLDKRGPFSIANVSVMSQSENSTMTNGFFKAQPIGSAVNAANANRRYVRAMGLAAQGLSRKQIAKRMGLSLHTIHNYFYQASHQ